MRATIADLRRDVPATRHELTIDIAAAFCKIQGMQSEGFEGEEECVDDLWITPEPERPHLLSFVGVVREASDLDGPPEGGLPADFIAARDLLASEGELAMARAVALVSKYFDCEFDASNVDLDLGEYVGLATDEDLGDEDLGDEDLADEDLGDGDLKDEDLEDEDSQDDEGDVGNDTDVSSDATSSDGPEHDR